MLKYEISDLNEIDEPLHSHYAREGDTGPYRLTLELPTNYTVEDVGGLKGALKKERDANKTLAARISELEGGNANDHKKLAGKVDQLAQQNAKLLSALNEQQLTNATIEAIHEAKGNPALLRPVLEKRIRLDDAGKPQVIDDAGQPLLDRDGTPVSIRSFLLALREMPAYQGAFAGTGSSGSGSPPSSGNGGTTTANPRRSQMTVAEKAAYLKVHGTEKFMQLPV